MQVPGVQSECLFYLDPTEPLSFVVVAFFVSVGITSYSLSFFSLLGGSIDSLCNSASIYQPGAAFAFNRSVNAVSLFLPSSTIFFVIPFCQRVIGSITKKTRLIDTYSVLVIELFRR